MAGIALMRHYGSIDGITCVVGATHYHNAKQTMPKPNRFYNTDGREIKQILSREVECRGLHLSIHDLRWPV